MIYHGQNKYRGDCEVCGERVYPRRGLLYREGRDFVVIHHRCLNDFVDVPHGLCDRCGRGGSLTVDGDRCYCARGCQGPVVFEPRFIRT